MEKFSVKKPFTVLVAVIAIIALGAVSLMNLSMDLLPEMSLPYMIVIATYPGADPKKVETLVTEPLENALGTISGVKNVTSTSSENYAMVQMEFEDGTDMDSAMVKLSGKLNQLEDSLPDEVGTPTIMEISMDMVATMYVAVERDGYDIYQLSDFVKDEIIPYVSRTEGVASISTIGTVEKSVVVELNQKKIDELNDRILKETDSKLQEASDKLDEAQEKLDKAQDKLKKTQSKFGKTLSSALFSQLNGATTNMGKGIKTGIKDLVKRLEDLQKAIESMKSQQDATLDALKARIDNAQQQLEEATENFKKLSEEVEAAQKTLDELTEELTNINQEDIELYNQKQAEVTLARQILEQAKAAYGDASQQVKDAQENYDAAVKALNEAIPGYEQLEDLSKEISEIIKILNKQSVSIDSSSVGALIDTTSALPNVLGRLSKLISTIKAADPTGILSKQIQGAAGGIKSLTGLVDSIPKLLTGVETMMSGLTQGQLDAAVGYSTAAFQMTQAKQQLEAAKKQFDDAKEKALENANADALISASTLSGLVYAQNFAMPAGYIDDKDDNSWLLTIGDSYGSDSEIAETLILDNETIGVVRLSDIADITVIDNADDSYTKLNGNDSIILSIYKSSASGTNDVSTGCNKAFEELEKMYPGTTLVNLMDQGNYIDMIVSSIFTSIAIGAALAIIILALFLKDIKPTIVVAISIPMSVLLALVLLYFTGLELNMMTLSGLSLGIGMLVDNSVVVMENIFRLRNSGLSAPRAAVQGAKQMRGSIVASTLTTICVFMPSVFASGTVKTLLYPLALSIGYCLVASLFIALTVVPASCSTIMKNTKPKNHKLFEKIQNGYGKSLKFCLKYKFIPLIIAMSLLVFSIYSVLRMGIIYIPQMTSNEISISIKTPEEMTRQESYEEVDNVMNNILKVQGVEQLGIMSSSAMTGFFTTSVSSTSYGRYTCNVVTAENLSKETIDSICKNIENSVASCNAEVTVNSGSMGDMSALMGGSGISIKLFGKDLNQLQEYGKQIAAILEKTEGLEEVTDGLTDGDQTLHLVIDKDKAMAKGFTVAQIYGQITKEMTTSVTSTRITVDGMDMTVTIKDETTPVTLENLLDMEFKSETNMAGAQASGMADMSSMFDDKDDEDDDEDEEEKEEDTGVYKLSDFAHIEETVSASAISHENLTTFITVGASTKEGYNATLISRDLEPVIKEFEKTLPDGYSVEIGGESSEVNEMVVQMLEMAALGLLFIYLIMVAQFQSLLSPFIILFTIPLAFTGGMLGLMVSGQQLSMLSLLGFVILMGTVVNNGIVFVDYANQLRIGGLERHDALIATGMTRMRPILMTALTTILAMTQMMFGKGMASQLGSGMAIVISGGLLYATFMTLYIVPVVYDIFFKRKPLEVDVGSDIDEVQDDAAEYLAKYKSEAGTVK